MQQKPAPTAESFQAGEIKDVVVRDLRKFNDRRGWLVELFRHDELAAEFFPVMAYISSTNPGVTRGPHEHVDQADLFCFLGPSNFKFRMWDNRPDSETFGTMMTLIVGADDPKAIIVPKGRRACLSERWRRRRHSDQLPEPPLHGRRTPRAGG